MELAIKENEKKADLLVEKLIAEDLHDFLDVFDDNVRVSFSCSLALIRRGSGQRHSQKLRAVSLPRTTSDPSWDQVTGNADYRLRLGLI
jgi:hypothetical protein